jgi:symplekin
MKTAQPELLNAATAPLSVEEDDDDYEPDFYNAEDTEQILNKLDAAAPPEEPKISAPDMAIGKFTLPPPLPLTLEEAAQIGQGTVSRVFGVMQTLEEPGKKPKTGINRLAASAYDRDAWITIITRLATRASAGLEEPSNAVKVESDATRVSLSNTIRESLYLYVLEDFRKRIDIAVIWLCEEWYNDKIQMKLGEEAVLHYEKWVLKILDGIVPYLDARDKILTRFLSEIPGLSVEVLQRVKGLCRDPALVNLSLTSLLYLVMFRPPVRDLALDAVEDVWNTCKTLILIPLTYTDTIQMMTQSQWQRNISRNGDPDLKNESKAPRTGKKRKRMVLL